MGLKKNELPLVLVTKSVFFFYEFVSGTLFRKAIDDMSLLLENLLRGTKMVQPEIIVPSHMGHNFAPYLT
jgi:hypothetical protein